MNEKSSDKSSSTESMFHDMNTSIFINGAASGQASPEVHSIPPVAAGAVLMDKAKPVHNLRASPVLLASIVALSAMSGALAYLTTDRMQGHGASHPVSHGSLPSTILSPGGSTYRNAQSEWLSASLIRVFNMDYANFRSQVSSTSDRFTEQGFQEFTQLLSLDAKVMIEENQVMQLTLQKGPQVQSMGYSGEASFLNSIGIGQRNVYTEFTVPVLRQFTSSAKHNTREDVLVVRVVSDDAYDGRGHKWLISSIGIMK